MTTLSTTPPLAGNDKRSWLRLLGWGLCLAVLAWSWQGAEMNPLLLIRDSANMATFAADFFPPDFSNWQLYLKEMITTVHIALWGTLLAIVCAIPLGILSSENIVPWWVYQPVRRLMDACRSINEMVFAMLFVVAVGLGPFAGVLALWISTTGVLAKLFAEAVEAIEPGPVEGVRATGASALQEVIFGSQKTARTGAWRRSTTPGGGISWPWRRSSARARPCAVPAWPARRRCPAAWPGDRCRRACCRRRLRCAS